MNYSIHSITTVYRIQLTKKLNFLTIEEEDVKKEEEEEEEKENGSENVNQVMLRDLCDMSCKSIFKSLVGSKQFFMGEEQYS